MTNVIFSTQNQTREEYLRKVDPETLIQRYGMVMDSLVDLERDLDRYHRALELIRDHSTDMSAVALANNVLMGIQTDFGFMFFPSRPKHQ